MTNILVVDDEHSICEVFAEIIALENHHPVVASSGREALQALESQEIKLMFLDVQMPGESGLQVLAKVREQYPTLPVVIMTAYGTMKTAVEAMRLGAYDYIGKPFDLKKIRELMSTVLAAEEEGETQSIVSAGDSQSTERELIGQSPPMQELFKQIGLLSASDFTVLITGESGVGKELVAQAIHNNSPRAEQAFICINCGAIPENLLESEFFGHEKGAFTGAGSRQIGRFEAAGEGSIFLDEISELPLMLQTKLLRVLQERSFERVGSTKPQKLQARIIAASNKDLQAQVEAGLFREDLYHRLKMATLDVPPLRDRLDDIPLLINKFIHQAGKELGKTLEGVDRRVLEQFNQYPWPGNVRELEHTIKRAVLKCRTTTIGVRDLDLGGTSNDKLHLASEDHDGDPLTALVRTRVMAAIDKPNEQESLFHQIVGEVETALVEEALALTGNNQVAAAKLLGLHRSTLRKKLAERKKGDEKLIAVR